MKNYKIKKEAVPFIKEEYASKVLPFDTWDKLGINMNALDEVKPAYITYGRKTSENSSTLCGWNENGASFEFTIHFPSMSFYEQDKFSKGRTIRELMERIQCRIDDFYSQYQNEPRHPKG